MAIPEFSANSKPVRRPTQSAAGAIAQSAPRNFDDPADDEQPEEEIDPLDDLDLEIEDEPDPDEGDFWIDPDEEEDPWN